jgi:hypothetical protein
MLTLWNGMKVNKNFRGKKNYTLNIIYCNLCLFQYINLYLKKNFFLNFSLFVCLLECICIIV